MDIVLLMLLQALCGYVSGLIYMLQGRTEGWTAFAVGVLASILYELEMIRREITK